MPDASSEPAPGDSMLSAQTSASLEHRPALLHLLCSSYSLPQILAYRSTGWCCSCP